MFMHQAVDYGLKHRPHLQSDTSSNPWNMASGPNYEQFVLWFQKLVENADSNCFKQKMNPNCQSVPGKTALLLAVQYGCYDLAEMIVKVSPDKWLERLDPNIEIYTHKLEVWDQDELKQRQPLQVAMNCVLKCSKIVDSANKNEKVGFEAAKFIVILLENDSNFKAPLDVDLAVEMLYDSYTIPRTLDSLDPDDCLTNVNIQLKI